MNIIKLYDIIMPDDKDPKIADFFNKNLKGKYAYWVKMRYIFPMDALNYKKYIEYEQKDQIFFLGSEVSPHIDMYSEDECLYDFANKYVDICETEKINSIQDYRLANKFAIDYDLDINKLRNFRTWLANELYNFDIDENGNHLNKYSSEQLHVLEYYKNDMYNDVIKYIDMFGTTTVSPISTQTSCGCCNTNLNSLTNSVEYCNSLSIYKKNIHNAMVSMFSDIEFWISTNNAFLSIFKKYVDNILNSGMQVISQTDKYNDCDCNYSNTSNNENILKSLSVSLGYIINDEITNHINYIHDALYNWADKLYDNMSWNIK